MSEARRRRAKSEHLLHRLAIRTNPDLDLLPESAELEPRSAEEIGKRALVLHAVVAYAQLAAGGGPSPALRGPFLKWFERERLWPAATEAERALFAAEAPEADRLARASWRIEAVRALLFALGLAPALGIPDGRSDFVALAEVLPDPSAAAEPFLDALERRPLTEILDAMDLALCVHWALVASDRTGEPPPPRIEPAVALERHHALAWTLGLAPAWD